MGIPRVVLDERLERREIGAFAFPLGAYPVSDMTPRAGYVVEFESADGGESPDFWQDGDEMEAWPDRFMFDVLVSAKRVRALARTLFSLLPGRVYPILDVLGHDAYREIDPYIAYDLVGVERFLDAIMQFGDWLFEDGLVGFGAMSVEPFVYIFVDEHKAVTVRVETALKDRVEKILRAFDLEPVEAFEGADAAEHEHRGVLASAEEQEDALTPDEIVERLRDDWRLQLNIDPHKNLDDEGRDLGVTPWRLVVRCESEPDGPLSYAEILLAADCLETAERLSFEAVNAGAPDTEKGWYSADTVAQDRLNAQQLTELSAGAAKRFGAATPAQPQESRVLELRWIAGEKAPPAEGEAGVKP